MPSFAQLDAAAQAAFDRDGYLFQRGCFARDEIALCNRVIATDPAIQGSRLKLEDAEGGSTELALWNHPGEDVFGMIARCRRVAGQTGADPERVEQALERLELVHGEMAPGDALFFHCNTLHCSAANLSDRSRNLLICCYNKATNDPYKPHHHPGYTRLEIVPDEAVLAAGDRLADAGGRWFLEAGEDETTEARKAS